MSDDELNDGEGKAPAKPSRPVSARMAQNQSKSPTASRPVTKSGTAAAGPGSRGSSTAARPTTSGKSARPPAPPVEQPPEMRSTSTRAQVILDDFEKAGGKDNTMLYVWIAMAVIVIGGGLAFLVARNIVKGRETVLQEKLDTRDRVMKKVRDLIANSPTKYDEIIAAATEGMKQLVDFEKEQRELRDIIVNYENIKEVERAKEESRVLLKTLENDVKDFAKLAEVEVRYKRVEAAMSGMDEDFQKRTKQLRADITLNTMKSYAAKAEDEATKAGNDYARALEAYDQPFKKFKDFLKNYSAKGPTKDDPIIQTYIGMIKKSDGLVDRLCTPDYIAKCPSRDMLSPKERGLWTTSKENGCEFTFAGRELVVAHKPVGEKKIIQVLGLNGWDAPAWYDIVFDLEFEILAGSLEVHLRFVPGLAPYQLVFDPKDTKSGYALNTTYHKTFRVIGSKVAMIEADQPESGGDIDPKVSRTGGIGFAIPTGSRIAIKALSMKVLRTQAGGK